MSTTAEVEDGEGLREVLGEVRNDSHPRVWALLGHIEGNPNMVGLLHRDDEDNARSVNLIASLISQLKFLVNLSD